MYLLVISGKGDGELHVVAGQGIPEEAIVARFATREEAYAAQRKLEAWAAHAALRRPVTVELSAPISIVMDGKQLADVVYPHISARLDEDIGGAIAVAAGPRP